MNVSSDVLVFYCDCVCVHLCLASSLPICIPRLGLSVAAGESEHIMLLIKTHSIRWEGIYIYTIYILYIYVYYIICIYIIYIYIYIYIYTHTYK